MVIKYLHTAVALATVLRLVLYVRFTNLADVVEL